ncbi:MAG TPA: hypothetical protein VFF04_01880 [Candidatus Babeliales bacterium]|nr:hypothetical protein [Candidatus Babeliales bacterium]
MVICSEKERKEENELLRVKDVIDFFRSPLYLNYKAERDALRAQLHKGASLTPQQFAQNQHIQKKIESLESSKAAFDVESARVTLGIPLLKYHKLPIKRRVVGTIFENKYLVTSIFASLDLQNSMPEYCVDSQWNGDNKDMGHREQYYHIKLAKNGRPHSPDLMCEETFI